jgi:uncharacterized protein YndB with AHSA1/START domain/ketosteroid isomerase-like protein
MTAESNRSLAITRVFEAPPDAVFRAWTDPTLARTWWSPRGFTTVSCDMDVRPGGAWRVRMRSPSGRLHDEGGVFREVSAPDRLVFSQVWDDPSGRPGVETLVTVTFAAHGPGATKVRFEQSGFATASSCDGHEGGWSSCFDRLSGELETPTAGGPSALAVEESRLSAQVESCAAAIRAKDVEGVMRHYAADAEVFDLAPPLVAQIAELRKGLEWWFGTWKDGVGWDLRDLRFRVGGAVAFGTALVHIHGERTEGPRTDVWVRATFGFRKQEGAWILAHEHRSVPFYMDGSERAATDLKP